jgi:hypothetical protein
MYFIVFLSHSFNDTPTEPRWWERQLRRDIRPHVWFATAWDHLDRINEQNSAICMTGENWAQMFVAPITTRRFAITMIDILFEKYAARP